ncbi:putative transmembrane protein [Toxoplasma gondii]|uniref:Putative transmembrane protein n=1 Tax=Toxoplasma gondii TaxID=5811 RepID=A0A7J6KFZ3_TOXGO|nr:putative transmembrane protein [Toxoplasma gondii]
MRTSVALFFAALGSISLPCTLHVSLAAPMQGTLGPDVPENIGEPPVLSSSSSDVPLRGAEGGSTQEGAVEGPLPQEWRQPPPKPPRRRLVESMPSHSSSSIRRGGDSNVLLPEAEGGSTQEGAVEGPLPQEWRQPPPKPPRRRLVESMRSNSSSSIGRGGESIVPGPENVANDEGGSPSDDLKIVQPEDVPPGGPGPKAPGVGTRMRNWVRRVPNIDLQPPRQVVGRMGRFVGGARRAVGRGWRRFTTGDASAFDDRAKKIVRLGATVQLIQLLAALHTRKVVHGKLEPKSVLLFSHGLLYLSDLGRARRQGERFTTSRPSRIPGTLLEQVD